MPHRIKDPQQENPEIALSALAAPFQSLENWLKFLSAPVDDPYAYVNLGMKDVLALQLLHQPVSDKFVVFRSAQPLGNGLEGHHETHEILIGVELLDVFFTQQIAAAVHVIAIIFSWHRSVVAATQFRQ